MEGSIPTAVLVAAVVGESSVIFVFTSLSSPTVVVSGVPLLLPALRGWTRHGSTRQGARGSDVLSRAAKCVDGAVVGLRGRGASQPAG